MSGSCEAESEGGRVDVLYSPYFWAYLTLQCGPISPPQGAPETFRGVSATSDLVKGLRRQKLCFLNPSAARNIVVKLDLQLLNSLWESAQNIRHILSLKFAKLNKNSLKKNSSQPSFDMMTATVDILMAETTAAESRVKAAASGICHILSPVKSKSHHNSAQPSSLSSRNTPTKNSLSKLLDQQSFDNSWMSGPVLPAIGLGVVIPMQPVLPEMSVHLTRALLRITSALLKQEEKSATILYLFALLNVLKKSIDDISSSIDIMANPGENLSKLASLVPVSTLNSLSDQLANPIFSQLKKSKMAAQLLNHGNVQSRLSLRKITHCIASEQRHNCECLELVLSNTIYLPDPRSACLTASDNNFFESASDYKTFKWIGLISGATHLTAAGSFSEDGETGLDIAILPDPLLRLPRSERAFLLERNKIFFPDPDKFRTFDVHCSTTNSNEITRGSLIDASAIGILTIFPNCKYIGTKGRIAMKLRFDTEIVDNFTLTSKANMDILSNFNINAMNFYNNSTRLAPNNFVLSEPDLNLLQHDIKSAKNAEIFLLERIRALEEKGFWTFVIELLLKIGGAFMLILLLGSLTWCAVSCFSDVRKSRKLSSSLRDIQLQISDHASLHSELERNMHSHSSILGLSPPYTLEHQMLSDRLRAEMDHPQEAQVET